MLTPPQGNDLGDINARGPCGMTPIMVAAVRGGGMDTGIDEDDDDGAGQIIQDLVAQGAELNATMDKTGETSLHLAARYARADAAKRLLDAGKKTLFFYNCVQRLIKNVFYIFLLYNVSKICNLYLCLRC